MEVKNENSWTTSNVFLRGLQTTVRKFLNEHREDEYNLVDVRTPREYEEDGHLPGARLMPVGELHERLAELDPKKTTIVY